VTITQRVKKNRAQSPDKLKENRLYPQSCRTQARVNGNRKKSDGARLGESGDGERAIILFCHKKFDIFERYEPLR
jgi:hypothetical protein